MVQAILFLHVCLVTTIANADQIRYCHLGAENQTLSQFIVQHALSALIQNQVLPSDTTMRYVGGNLNLCDDYIPLGTAVQVYNSVNADIDVIIGPLCSSGMDPTAKLAVYWNLPILGYVSSAEALGNKMLFKTLGRVYSTQKYAGQAMKYYMAANGWHRAALVKLANTASACNLVGQSLASIDDGGSQQIKIVYQADVANTSDDTALTPIFDEIKRSARIVVLCLVYKTAVETVNTRDFMLKAYQRNLTGPDYLYLLVFGGRSSLIWQMPWEAAPTRPDGLDSEAKKAFQAAIIIEPLGAEVKRFQLLYQVLLDGTNISIFDPAQAAAWSLIHFRDAVYLYGLGANKTFANGVYYYNDGLKVFKGMQCQKFDGLTGLVETDKNAERIPLYTLSALTSANGNLTEFGSLIPQHYTTVCQDEDPNKLTYIYAESRQPFWRTINNKPPPDTPPCGYFNEYCQENYTWLIAFGVILCCILITVISLLVYWQRKRQYEYELFSRAWAIKPTKLQIWNSDRPMMGSVANFAIFGAGDAGDDHSGSNSQTSSKQLMSMFTSTENGNFGTEEAFSGAGVYEGQPVDVEMLPKLRTISLKRADLVQLKRIRDLQNDNLNIFVGANFEEERTVTILWRRGARGSLEDVLFNDDIQLDMMFKASMIKDVIRGLEFLHKSPIGIHGSLVAENCVVDGRWVVKLTNFGLDNIIDPLVLNRQLTRMKIRSNHLYHFAPEVLRARNVDSIYPRTQQADIYSFGMILYQILTRETLFYDSNMTDTEILLKLEIGTAARPFRPTVPKTVTQSESGTQLMQLAKDCWVESPENRPPIGMVKQRVYRETKHYSKNIMDHMVSMLEKYANNLEKIVEDRTKELEEEKKRSDQLLVQLLPPSIASALKQGKTVAPEIFESATIYFSDIVGFTNICGRSTPFQVVDMLNALYTAVDEIIAKHDAYKVETIGDAYLVASGIPVRNGQRHAMHIADMALAIRKFIGYTFKVPHEKEKHLQLRIGMHSGSVAAGVVGMIMPRYCLFGDTVNVASRMESSGCPMKIQISEAAKSLLSQHTKYNIDLRGTMNIKGKGNQTTYWLNEQGRRDSNSTNLGTIEDI